MKVGVIGAGYWGKKHVEEYAQIGVGVIASDLLDENLKICKDKFSVKTTENHQDILSDNEIMAVSICTPNNTHYELCRECMKAGKHVFLEKPMTLDYKKALELVALAKEKGLVLAVGHLYRFNNAVRKLKEMVDAGGFGEVYSVKMVWTNLEPVFPDRGILFDLAIHPLDIINYVFGKSPDKAYCMARGFRQKNEEVAFVNGSLGKKLINLELSWITPNKVRDLVLVGSQKTAFVRLVEQKMTIRDNETGDDDEVGIEESNTIRSELEDFLDCIKNKKEPVANGMVGAQIIKDVENMKKV